MAIDIPPQKPSANAMDQAASSKVAQSSVTDNSAVKAAQQSAAAIQIAMKAEVISAKRLSAPLEAGDGRNSPRYEATLLLNSQNNSSAINQRPLLELSAAVKQQLTAGQPLLIKIHTAAPLQQGQQLSLSLEAGALKLLEITPPKTEPLTQAFIRQQMALQSSYVELLSGLMETSQLLNRTDTKNANAPKDLFSQQLVKLARNFIQTLTTAAQASTSEGIKTAIENSGIFYEKQIFKTLKQLQPKTQTSSVTNNAAESAPAKLTDSHRTPEMIQQLKKQIKQLRTLLEPQHSPPQSASQAKKAAKTATTPSNTNSSPGAKTALTTGINEKLTRNLKFNLLKLEQQLQKLVPANANEATQPPSKANQQPSPTTTKNLTSQPGSQNPLHQYTQHGTQETLNLPGKPLIHPPLPGQIHIQPQPIRINKPNKASFADAIAGILLKNTREAISRLNLHQMASLPETARSETNPAPVNYSFELPFVQNNELALFQFRITEEEAAESSQKNNKTPKKKWVIHMGFDLEGLGPMFCQATLIESQAAVTFWAEQQSTVDKSRQALSSLKQNLDKLGVTVKEIKCLQGSPPTDHSGVKQSLIDIKT